MINAEFGLPILPIFDLLLIIGSIRLAIAWGTSSHQLGLLAAFLLSGQAFMLMLAGVIYQLQGWRLDPVLFFAIFLLHVIILGNLIKDWLILSIVGDR